MKFTFQYAILLAVGLQVPEYHMQFEGSKHDEKPLLDRILAVINFLLVLTIVFCLDYAFIHFLFR